jgi:hypothetical protein
MYNDQNYNSNRPEDNGGYNYSSNGNGSDERTYTATYLDQQEQTSNTPENTGYDPNAYSSGNNYSENLYSGNTYSSGENTATDYTRNEYSNSEYSTSGYSDNYASNSSNGYDAAGLYNTGSYQGGYNLDSPQYMDLLDKSERLAAENDRLISSRATLVAGLVVSLLLLFASVGYTIYSEIKQPLFGKWPKMAEENEMLQAQAETLGKLRIEFDSLREANNILVENVTPAVQSGVFFEVQIGAFEKFDLQKYSEDLSRLRGENAEGMNKYVLGRFRNFKRAQAFKDDVQRMGIADAFIAGTVDGQRVELSDAVKASKKSY